MPDPALNGLYDLKLGAFGWAELAAALALGVLLSVVLGGALHLFRRRATAAKDPLAAIAELPEDARAMALAGMLRKETDRLAPGEAPWPERAAARFKLDPDTAKQLANPYHPGARLDPEPLLRALTSLRRV